MAENLNKLLDKENLDKSDLTAILNLTEKDDLSLLYKKACEVKNKYTDGKAYFRGLIELSNICVKNCLYCGIRRDGQSERFCITADEVERLAKWAYDNNYGSVTLQAGERSDPEFIEMINVMINGINRVSNSNLGITLSLGEQTEQTYRYWRELGAHRYLLRIETSNKELYKKIHPDDALHSFQNRVDCIRLLKKTGYQVGTGVMIGLPFQTVDDLVNDILFFKQEDIDMIGMGPYVVHADTPLGAEAVRQDFETEESKKQRLSMSLKMIAAARLFLKDVNIAATTALQALDPNGRELGILAGANILMPIITPLEYRQGYQLYDGKPCLNDDAVQCKDCLISRIKRVGVSVGLGARGDSPHFKEN